MTEIIRPGFRDPAWSDEVECLGNSISPCGGVGCGALVRITLADLFLVEGSLDVRFQPKHAMFRCPCGAMTEHRLSAILALSGLLPSASDWKDPSLDRK